MPTRKPTDLLPTDLAFQVLRALGDDAVFDVGAIVRATELSPEQIATQAAAMAYGTAWRGRMELRTRDRVRHMVEQHFAPPEPPPVDPIAESFERNVGSFDPWARHSEVNEPAHVVQLRGAGRPTTIEYIEGDDAA